ncbi:putative disease resistance protein RGA4 [Typha angustifolia]|uniref:putative disease resistance protein RGA4 n=1 Tax=Typha angustifolia TaxID=59011 RepID=UPI003C2ADFE5
MGDEALSAFLQVLFENIVSLLKEELRLHLGLQKELKDLMNTVFMIKAVLRDAEERQHDEAVKQWLDELRDFAYDAMDVLDEYATEAQRRKLISFPRLRNSSLAIANPKRVIFHHEIANKVKEIKIRMDIIAKRRDTFGLRVQDAPRQHGEGSSHHKLLHSSTSLNPRSVFGREEDKKKIVSMLVSSNEGPENSIPVIPILGEPGVGKTTIAQLVFRDETVLKHFETRLWVHVSHEFDRRRIIKSIIESGDHSLLDLINLNVLEEHLQKKLHGSRYLLVLDDLWNESPEEWEWLSRPLLYGAKGSKILVTTRSELVARTVGNSHPYRLQSLSDDACWSLFCEKVEGTNQQASSDLYMIRGEIVKKCQGLPLLAISIGHRLHWESNPNKWKTILQSEMSGILGRKSDVMDAIKLSYERLPFHLKPCFAYFSLVPKGFQFEKELIVQFWMAQGFIQPIEGERIEDTGANYFDSLLLRSFIQSPQSDCSRSQQRYSVYETMHEVARKVSEQECCILEHGSTNDLPENTRHLTLNFWKLAHDDSGLENSSGQIKFDRAYRCKGLYTLLLVGGSLNCQLRVPDNLAKNLGSLRILDLSNFGLTMLPESIGDLKHLRCLQLRDTKIRCLPDKVSCLYNLQTLGLRNCYYLEELPKDMKNLRKLRHLDLHLDDQSMVVGPGLSPAVYTLKPMPQEIGLLTDLQTLSRFVIGTRSGSGISELKELNNIHGELLISNLHLVKNVEEAAKANLTGKRFIQRMDLLWSSSLEVGPKSHGTSVQHEVLACLRPHTNLKELSINGYGASAFPTWIGDAAFSNLVTLRISSCKCESLPPLGGLPHLRNLYISRMDHVESVDCSFCGTELIRFPSLEKLHFENMPNLQAWHGDDDNCSMPSLHELVFKDCVDLRQLRHNLTSLTKLTIEGSPLFIGLRKFESLKHLEVKVESEWIWDSWPCLASLFSLKLSCLPTRKMPSGLSRIHTSIQHLEISHFYQLLSLPDDCLPCGLTYLSISHCPRICGLPTGIQLLKALEDLNIQDCMNITYLPELENLTSLVRLEISGCQSLSVLPSLPNTLQFLSINDCPKLSQNCKDEGNPDQVKITRIFSVWIDKQHVVSSSFESHNV